MQKSIKFLSTLLVGCERSSIEFKDGLFVSPLYYFALVNLKTRLGPR